LVEESTFWEEGLAEKAKEWVQTIASTAKVKTGPLFDILQNKNAFELASHLGVSTLGKLKDAIKKGAEVVKAIPLIVKEVSQGAVDFSKMSSEEKNAFIQKNWDKISDKIQEWMDKYIPGIQSYLVAALIIIIATQSFKNGPSSAFSTVVFKIMPKYLLPALQGKVKWNDVFKDEFDSILEHFSGNLIELLLGAIPIIGDSITMSKLVIELLQIMFNKDGQREAIAAGWKENIIDPLKTKTSKLFSSNDATDFFGSAPAPA
jgi:hypothetical protein